MMRTCGIVLAAGASTRMGRPKALLPMPDGRPLALHQAELLGAAGCDPVVIVLGSDAERIRPKLGDAHVAVNAAWETGRFSSIQAGIRACPESDGYLILPVDTVGVSAATLQRVLARAAARAARALRPCYRGEPGRMLWIDAALAHAWEKEGPADVRIDERLRDIETRIELDDTSLLQNVNTPDAWRAFISSAKGLGSTGYET